MRSKTCSGLLAAALTVLAVPAWAEIQPQGRELRVNRRVDFKQINPAAAFSPAGNGLVVWENDQKGIRGQFYGTDNQPAQHELTLVENQSVPSLPFAGEVVNRREPAVAFLGNGQFLLAFTEERAFLRSEAFYERRTIHDQDVYVQRFSVGGAPLGEKARLNTTTSGFQREPRLLAVSGGFVAVWVDAGAGAIVGRALDAAGQPVGAEVRISEKSGERPALAANGKGRVLVAWDGADGSELGVFARLLDASAKTIGPEFRVNTETVNRQVRPAAAADKAGNFFVVWQGERREFWRGFFFLYGQTVGAGGNLVGPQIRLYDGNLAKGSPQIAPAVAATPSGHFLLTWLTWKDTFGMDMAGVELDALGAPVGEAFWITERRVQANFREIALAANGAGKFLVSWETVNAKRQVIAARRLNAN
jgi:hypothetical protein